MGPLGPGPYVPPGALRGPESHVEPFLRAFREPGGVRRKPGGPGGARRSQEAQEEVRRVRRSPGGARSSHFFFVSIFLGGERPWWFCLPLGFSSFMITCQGDISLRTSTAWREVSPSAVYYPPKKFPSILSRTQGSHVANN